MEGGNTDDSSIASMDSPFRNMLADYIEINTQQLRDLHERLQCLESPLSMVHM